MVPTVSYNAPETRQFHAYIAGRFEPSLVRGSPQFRAILAQGWIEVRYETVLIEDGEAVTFHFERHSPFASAPNPQRKGAA